MKTMKTMKNEPNINIQRNFYTMATVDRDSAEIVMYGDIVETQPRDWWTDEPIPGSYIIQDEFLNDLKQIENCKDITIRMNSCGGDAGVSSVPRAVSCRTHGRRGRRLCGGLSYLPWAMASRSARDGGKSEGLFYGSMLFPIKDRRIL